jgi:hypothetical protein
MITDISGFTEPYGTDDHVRNEVLQRVEGNRNILQTTKRRKANRIGHILHKKCLLKHFIGGTVKGRTEVTGRRERRREEPLGVLKEKRGHWKLKEE